MCNPSRKMTNLVTFAWILVIHLVLHDFWRNTWAQEVISEVVEELPEINIVNKPWAYLDSTNSSILAQPDSQITMNCTAHYPIKWVILGQQGEHLFHAGRRKTNLVYKNSSQSAHEINSRQLVYSVETWNYFEKDSVASVRAVCQSATDDNKSSSVNIFISDKRPQIICPPKSRRLPRGNVVPCPVTDPRLSVKLFKRNPNPSTHLTAIRARYDPVLGFRLSDTKRESGTFICVTPRDVCTVFLGDDKNEDGFFAEPDEESVTQWSNETLKVSCRDKIPVQFEIQSAEHVISRRENDIILEGHNGDHGTVICRGANHSHTWNYIFVDPPQLRFNCQAGEIDCLSEGRNKSVSSVRCQDKNDCSLLRQCFDDENCHNENQLYFTGEPKEGYCPTVNSSSCISFRNLYFNGIIECGVANRGKTAIFEFFTGLSLLKYLNWRDAPTDELIRMDSVSPVLYANETTLFVCEASSYLFSDGFHYEIKFENDTRIILDKDSLKVNKYIQERRQVYELNIVSAVEILLPVGATEITCFASLADEPLVLHASRTFVVKYLRPPQIFTEIQNVEFQLGSVRQRLICSVRGEPDPYTRWEINGQAPGPEFITRRTSEGDCILEFPTIAEEHADVYKCIASNVLGNDKMIFNVSVEVENTSTPI